MATIWKSIYFEVPSDLSTCWVRPVHDYRQPFAAVWHAATQTFISVTTSTVLPAYMVWKWRAD